MVEKETVIAEFSRFGRRREREKEIQVVEVREVPN